MMTLIESKSNLAQGLELRRIGTFSASLNRRSENVIVKAIIVPELELRNVKVQVFLANIVESANDSTLEDAPEAFNRIGVHCANDVLLLCVVDSGVRVGLAKAVVPNPLIGAEAS